MTISILGCGWLGLPLGKALVKAGYTVKGSTTSPEKLTLLQAAGIEPFLLRVEEAIIGNKEEVTDFFKTDLLILNIPPGRRQPNVEEYHPQQIKAIGEWILEMEIPQVLFISSSGVYPNCNRTVTEEDDTAPERASSKALVIAENYLQLHSAFETTILRMSGLVGGDRKAGRFFAGKTDVPNGKAPVNMVHRTDCIGVILELIRLKKWGEIFNVCADEHPTKEEFYIAQAFKDDFDPPSFKQNEVEVDFKIVSNKKVKMALGYEFKHPDPMDF